MRRSLVANLPVQAPPGPAPIICARIKAALCQAPFDTRWCVSTIPKTPTVNALLPLRFV